MEQLKPKKMIRLPLLPIAALLLSGCNDKLTVINYFIPKSFEGNIAIIYSKTDSGKQDVYNFTIPKNGTLIVPYRFYKGDYIQNYYQLIESNKYDTLQVELPSFKIDTTKNRIYFNRILTFEKKGMESVVVETFYVGKKKPAELVKERFLFENKLEKIILDEK